MIITIRDGKDLYLEYFDNDNKKLSKNLIEFLEEVKANPDLQN